MSVPGPDMLSPVNELELELRARKARLEFFRELELELRARKARLEFFTSSSSSFELGGSISKLELEPELEFSMNTSSRVRAPCRARMTNRASSS